MLFLLFSGGFQIHPVSLQVSVSSTGVYDIARVKHCSCVQDGIQDAEGRWRGAWGTMGIDFHL